MGRRGRRGSQPEPAPARGKGRRALLGIAGLAAGTGGLIAAIGLLTPTRPSLRLGEVRGVMPPLLRAIVPGVAPRRVRNVIRADADPDADDRDVVLYLLRIEQRTYPDRSEGPSPIEMITLIAASTDDGWRAWSTPVATVQRGALADAAILGLQGRTAWVWADGLRAYDVTNGALLADPAQLAALNPDLPLEEPGLRRRLGFAEALTLDGQAPGQGWVFDPASLRAFRRAATPPMPLPLPVLPAGDGASPLVQELRVGETWFGVLPEAVALPETIATQDAAGRFLRPIAFGDHGPWRLWRGRLRRRADAMPDAAPPSAGDVLEAVAPLRLLPGEGAAGLLSMGGGAALTAAAPASVFVVHDRGLAETGLIRLALDGRTLWEARLDAPVLVAALAGPRRLVVVAGRGEGGRAEQSLFSVALADGAVRGSGISA